MAVGALCVAAYVYVGRKNADINVYTYEEMPAEGYSASYSKENGAVTATNTTYKTGFNTAKVWQASEGKNITGSSDIVLNVSANGESAGNVTLTAAEGYSGMYTQLNESPVYQIVDDGKEDDPATANVLYYASGHDYGDDWQTVIYEPYYEPDVAELTLTWTDNVTHRVRMFDGNWNVTGWYTFTDGTHTVQIAPGTEAVFIDAYLYDLVSITSGDIHKADTVYSGQYISILGDSYSAVTPTIWTTKYDTDDEGYSVVNRWWSTVLDDTGANLLMNASRGGRAIAHVATSEDRPGVYWTDKLHLGDVYPDTIFIFLGINDLNFDTVGTMKKNYSSMVGQIMKNYPSANIITCTYPICTWSLYDVDKYLSMNEAIRSIAREYGLLCLDLEQTDFGFGTDFANMTSSEITAAMKTMNANYLRTDDDVHHNAAGEAIIGAKAAELLREFNIVTYTVAEAQTSGYTADYYWNGNEMTVTNILDKQTKPS
ncbi:MAG: SGNH/GDSL hydrolase family protein [Eubacteriales bacterium]|nr:SGNH/GDSL hydrolase family protein [Eubacteriales bacterium]